MLYNLNSRNVIILTNCIKAENPDGIREAWASGSSVEREIMSAVLITAREKVSMSSGMRECVANILSGKEDECLS
ncbi:MAG: hypothetical protein A2288_02445 [Candidatus Moranbacteria bacterium RIFOXYA12_FULL_44_15]|nr:MAG: hypothetical protein A2288_02445 [Candidatus Moranbacteria bacterium RIFOXYA12_FULL_44_15]OGI34318.1 MAG: hypothetical protein A2259_03320 [Candidatus Moranbacteria bacterium RIFOXYA2_FULL_43_15]